MPARALYGYRSGDYGLWASKPGYDVRFCNIVQMAFDSRFTSPKLIARGTIAVPSINGGRTESVGSVYYGKTISTAPFVVAMVNTPDWTFSLAGEEKHHLQYLNSMWHTPVLERPVIAPTAGQPYGKTNLYGPEIQRTDVGPYATFASAKFTLRILGDRVDFLVNNRNTVLVKYIILEP